MTQLGIDWSPRQASQEARNALAPARLRDDHRKILAALAAGPMTDMEILAASGVHPNAERARRGELEVQGLVIVAGHKVQNGRRATLWGLK